MRKRKLRRQRRHSVIVIAQPLNLYPDQIKHLKKLGSVKIYNNMPKSPEEWFRRVKNAGVICCKKFGLKDKIYSLENKYISLPLVGIGWIDFSRLKDKNVIVSNSPGCNRDAVAEWITGTMIMLARNLKDYSNPKKRYGNRLPESGMGMAGKRVCILGKGDIGSKVGKICKALDMKVCYFKRGDSLVKKTGSVDIVINCLSHNKTTEGMLDRKFFLSLKKNSYFISITGEEIFSTEAMLEALDRKILVGAGLDAEQIQAGNTDDPYYRKLSKHHRIIITPHIAYSTDVAVRIANDMMINNIKAWLKGRPVNVVGE